jgi:hypothetical protein
MTDLDQEMRALLEEDARQAPPVPEAEPALRRTRRRQLVVVLTAIAVAAIVAIGSTAGAISLLRSSGRLTPANPSSTAPSPTASPTAPSPSPSKFADDMATFTSTNPAYSFQYPVSCKNCFKEGTSGTQPMTLEFRPGGSVALTLHTVPSGTTLETYGRASRRLLAQRGFTIFATHRATMGGQPALVIEYTKVKWMITFKYARFFTINGVCAYILTFGAADKYFDANYETVVSMAESFRFGG